MRPVAKKILDSKILYLILSILISVSLWIWVTSRDENKETQPFNLPVTFEGVDILEDRGLMIVNEDVRVNVRIQATPMILASLSTNPPRLTANVANISTEGTHPVVYTYSLPSGVNSSDVEMISGASGTAVNVEVARASTRKVRIQGEFQGTVAEGYLPGDKDDFLFSPGELTISGRAELVNQVAYAKVIVTGQDLTETVSGEFPFLLIGASDDPLELDVTCDVDMIYVSFPIRATAEIPLEVKLTPGGGLSEGDVRIEPSAGSIVVAGTREAVDALAGQGAINLTTVDLATVRDGDEFTIPIPLDDELENLSGVTEVKFTIDVRKKVEARTFEATNITVINVPEGWQPDIITQALQVEVRGTTALLDELAAENIRVVADLQEIEPAAQQYTVPAKIYLDSAASKSEIGEMDPGSYTIVISLSQGG